MNNLFEFELYENQLGVKISHFYVEDSRGSFAKIYEKDIFMDNGIDFPVSEVFFSTSKKNVIRGIHFQLFEPQAKIVSVISGRAWDVIVDLRPESRTFKKWQGFWLDENDNKSVLVPPGFGHGFLSNSDNMKMIYLCSGKYNRESDSGIRFDDPELAIDWPIDRLEDAILCERDLSLMRMQDYILNPMTL